MASAPTNRLSEYLPLLAFSAAWSLQLVYFLGYDARIFFTNGFGILSLILIAVASYVIGFFAGRVVPVLQAHTAPARALVGMNPQATRMLTQLTVAMAALLITANILVPLAQGISLSGARELALENWENGSVFTRVVAVAANITIAFSLMAIIDRIDITGKFPILLITMFVLLTIAAYSRAHLLLGLSIVSTKWIARSKYRLTSILFIFALFAGLFSALSVFASVGSVDRAAGIGDIYRSIEVYTFGGVAGFEFFYTTGLPQFQTLLTLPRFVYSLLPSLGAPPPSYFPFIDTDPPINVFSALYPPYHDFGQSGLMAFFFLYGIVSALAAIAFSRVPRRFNCVLSGFLLYAALMSPFDDQFIRGLTILLLIMSGTVLYSLLDRILRSVQTGFR